MVSMSQFRACQRLKDEGYVSVGLPFDPDHTPIPGMMLMVKPDQTSLVKVLPDGRAIDLLAVRNLAEECIRYVGDFGRLNPLADALNGRQMDFDRKEYTGG